jgi:hypothetical protein
MTTPPTETGFIPNSHKPFSPVPCYDWLSEETRAKIEAFNAKREAVLKDRADALKTITRARASVNEGTFSTMTLKAVEKARAELAVADAAELHLALQAGAMYDHVKADNHKQIEEAKRAIDDREKEIKAAGAKAGKHSRVVEAEIETDSEIQAICESCPERLELGFGAGKVLDERAEYLSANLEKLFKL